MQTQTKPPVVQLQRTGTSFEGLRNLPLQASSPEIYSVPGAAAWLPEDDEAVHRLEQEIDYGLKQGLSTMQGKIQSHQDIADLLAARWKSLRSHFNECIERSCDDHRKWRRYYTTTTKQSNKLECMDHCFSQVANAMCLSLSKDLLPTEYKTESTEHDLLDPPPGFCSKNAIVHFKHNELCVLGLNNHSKRDQNRFEARRDANNKIYTVPRPPEILKEQALEQSDILFQQLMHRFDGNTKKVGTLSMIWRLAITNSITKYTILKAHHAIGKSSSCWCRFRSGKPTGNNEEGSENVEHVTEEETRAFQNLVATDNGKIGMRLLADHRAVFGEKDIEEVYTFPAGCLPALTYWVMVFRLG